MLFYDPSIRPILTTNNRGEFLNIKTYGLRHYGIPDLILNHYVEDYEDLFLGIIHLIFKDSFNSEQTWNHDGKIFRLKRDSSGYNEICFENDDQIQIISILNPMTDEPIKHISKGILSKYRLPEFEIMANINDSKALLAFVISEIEKGEVIDEFSSIEINGYIFCLEKSIDRFGSPLYEIRQVLTKTLYPERRLLKRIK